MNFSMRQNHFLAVILLAIAIFIYMNSLSIPVLASDLNIIGAAFFPKLLAVFLGGMAVFIAVDRTNTKRFEFRTTREVWLVLLFTAMLFLYIYLMSVIGFEITSFVFLGLTMWLLGLRKIPVLIGIAVILPAIVYVVFVNFMYIPIPNLIQGL
ncbi:hypothetical protein FACS1894206_05540 [Deltaproteobacteria bacterium]|nr:hypothetical protein FACS1894206_05540 [Deltaproteobacteria bacterium]